VIRIKERRIQKKVLKIKKKKKKKKKRRRIRIKPQRNTSITTSEEL